MKGLYEQIWQKAIAEAKVEPSEAVWENIASSLDKTQGRNYWVILLMIAATITIAFSFPLTIGNASFEVLPNTDQRISQYNNFDLKTTHNFDSITNENNRLNNLNSLANSDLKQTQIIHEEKAKGLLISTDGRKSKSIFNDNSTSIVLSPLVLAENCISFDFGIELQRADINNHYLIPYFMPVTKSTDRGLLATLNMGTGNSSSRNGNSGMLRSATPDFNSAEAFNNDKTFDNREEAAIHAFYFGMGIEFPLGKRFAVLAGLGYLAQKAEGYSNMVSSNGDKKEPMAAYDPITPSTIFLSSSYRYSVTNSYITAPLSIKYPLINRKIKLRLGAGLSTDFMVSHTISSTEYGKASNKLKFTNYNPIVLSGLINFDVNYVISNQYSVALETGFRKGITPIDTNKQYYPTTFTLGVVLNYKLKRD